MKGMSPDQVEAWTARLVGMGATVRGTHGDKPAAAKRVKPTAAFAYDPPATFTLPIATVSEVNKRGVNIGRKGGQVKAVARHLGPFWSVLGPFGDALRANQRVTITLTRLGGRMLDRHDNLPSAFKAVLDGIALVLGIDDSASGLHVLYDQEPGPGPVGIRIGFSKV